MAAQRQAIQSSRRFIKGETLGDFIAAVREWHRKTGSHGGTVTHRRFDASAKAHWLEYNYPLTIIADRYGGTYSGGVFLALPLDFDDIPHEIADSDIDCGHFWGTTNADDRLIPCGRGDTPQEAYEDLLKRMGQEE